MNPLHVPTLMNSTTIVIWPRFLVLGPLQRSIKLNDNIAYVFGKYSALYVESGIRNEECVSWYQRGQLVVEGESIAFASCQSAIIWNSFEFDLSTHG